MGREEMLVVIDCQPGVIRAGVGVHEVIRLPICEIKARVGIRTHTNDIPHDATEYLVGKALEEAEKSHENLEIVWPLVMGQQGTDGIVDWDALHALLQYVMISGLNLPARPLAYHILITHPPWLPTPSLERLCQVMFERLYVTSCMFIDRATLIQSAAGVLSSCIVDFGESSDVVSVECISDCQVVDQCSERCYIGEQDCDNYLCQILLRTNPALPGLLSPSIPLNPHQLQSALLKIVEILKSSDTIQFASKTLGLNLAAGANKDDEDEGITDLAAAMASGKAQKIIEKKKGISKSSVSADQDIVEVPHPLNHALPSIEVGPERHRYAEPLFDSSLLSALTLPSSFDPLYSTEQLERKHVALPEVIALSINRMSSPIRQAIWENIVITGRLAQIKGISSALIQTLTAKYMASPLSANEVQPRVTKHVRIPDYFSEYKDRQDLAAFLGGCIYAKVGFSEIHGGNPISKVDYSSNGPAVVRMLRGN